MADKEIQGLPRPVPTLSKKLTQKTLGSKKKVIRNILLNPHSEYWPILSASESKAVLDELQRHPKVQKEKKKKNKKKPSLKSSIWCESTEWGINAVSRHVKKHDLASVLLAEDVDPKFMMQHIITMCAAEGVPVLVVQGLRIQLKSVLGFSSAIIGFKNCITDKNNVFHQLHTLIVEFAKLHKPPAHLLQFKKPTIDTIKLEDTSPKFVKSLKEESTCNPIASSTLYLIKTSTSKAFVPPSREKLNNVKLEDEQNSSEELEFISLSSYESEEESNNVNSGPLGISHTILHPKKKQRVFFEGSEKKPRNSFVQPSREKLNDVKLEDEQNSSEELEFISLSKYESEEESNNVISGPLGISHTILHPKKKQKIFFEGSKKKRRKSGFPPPLEEKLNESQKPNSMVDSNTKRGYERIDNTEVKIEMEGISLSGGTSDHPSEEKGRPDSSKRPSTDVQSNPPLIVNKIARVRSRKRDKMGNLN